MKSKRGITLVELMVVIALLAFLTLTLLSFFTHITKIWRHNQKQSDAFLEGQAALSFMTKDLRGLYVNQSLPFYLNNVGAVKLDADLPPKNAGDMIFFLSTHPANGQDHRGNKSDLCSIGYYLSYSQPNKSYSLHRYFKSSDKTWSNQGSGISYGIFHFLINKSNLFCPASDRRGYDDVLAVNIIDFFIKAYRQDLTEMDQGAFFEKPSFFEISLTAYGARDVGKFSSQEDWHRPREFGRESLGEKFMLRVGY
ncbi:MAG: prepilin-type N-terminal cleavage/methylation domain-containing protein [Verrucomicrobiota bacterium]